MSNTVKEYWAAVKWILLYLKGKSSVCLQFNSGKPLLEGFTDSDMSADVDISRSMFGYVMTYAGGAILWQSRLQKFMVLSTTEAGKEVIWMKDFIGKLGIRWDEFRLYCNSQRSIHHAKNAAYHSRTKHIQRRYHWLREKVEEKDFVLSLTKIHMEENGSDMLTKVLMIEKLDAC